MSPTATPVGHLASQDWMTARPTRRVLVALTAKGAEVRFVGGCVRDALAGRPVKDIDIATHLPPAEVIALLEAAGLRAVPTGLAHGTITAIADHKAFEITTLREDVETFGRHARVAFTDDWTADAARRDFTFNALSCAPDGRLYDPFGGVADLEAGRVRFVGDPEARIREDYLRLLRFFRFQAHYGRTPPEPAVLDIAVALAPELERLSGERIRAELFKTLLAPDPLPVVGLMLDRGILRPVLPVTGDTTVLVALIVAEQAALPGEAPEPPEPVLRLAALIAPERSAAEATADRLRLSTRQRFALVHLAEPLLDPLDDVSPRDRHRLVRKLSTPLSRALLRLSWARRHAGEAAPRPGPDFADALAEVPRLAAIAFPLSGRDALAAGVPEGPAVGRLLDAVEDWWAARDFRPGRKDCLARLRALAKGAG